MRGRVAPWLVAATTLAIALPAQAQSAQEQLWDAAIAGDTVALRAALSNQARVDSLDIRRSRNGRRALNWAALNNSAPAIRVLLAAGASVDSANLTGYTALHHAAEANALEAARALLSAGADPRKTMNAGFTASQIARRLGNDDVAAVLEDAERVGPQRRP